MTNTISLKELRPELPRVVDSIDQKLARYIVTKRGKPIVVMLSAEDYESLMETLDILADPKAVSGIREGEADYKAGKTRSWQELKRSLAKL